MFSFLGGGGGGGGYRLNFEIFLFRDTFYVNNLQLREGVKALFNTNSENVYFYTPPFVVSQGHELEETTDEKICAASGN